MDVGVDVVIDADYVKGHLSDNIKQINLQKYIL